jgi:hypothetical protein
MTDTDNWDNLTPQQIERLGDELASDAANSQDRISYWNIYGNECYAERPTEDDHRAVAEWKTWYARFGNTDARKTER